MARLFAEADPTTWVPVTESFGFRGRRHRKAALRMLVAQMTGAMGAPQPRGGRFATWAMSQAAPALMRKAAGRVLVWVHKTDPELVVVMATIQQATSQMRAARAMRPMEYDDTVNFGHPTLGVGEKLVMGSPNSGQPPFVQYSWDRGTDIIEVTAIAGDPNWFPTTFADLDALAREIRVIDDMTVTEGAQTLRIDPA